MELFNLLFKMLRFSSHILEKLSPKFFPIYFTSFVSFFAYCSRKNEFYMNKLQTVKTKINTPQTKYSRT